MAFEHGVYISEVPTSVRPPTTAEAGLPVVVGASPVCLGDRANVNKPVLCTSLAEFNSEMGFIGAGDLADYSLCRMAQVHFGLYGMQPIIAINVLNPDDAGHMDAVPRAAFAWAAAEMSQTISVHGIDHETVVLDDGAMVPVAYTLTTDYTLAYDTDGYTVVTRLAGGGMGAGALPLCHLTYSKMDPAGVDTTDIIGAASVTANTGLYCIEDVYPRLQKVPGMILAPGYSHEPTVEAVMVARAASINGVFKALVVVDLPADGYDISDYADCAAWKSSNGYTAAALVCCWPKVTDGTDIYELSCHFAGLANKTDAGEGAGVPYVSPSNKATTGVTGACLDDGTEVFLTLAQANTLNENGIVTALNWTGWRLWGNRTAAYPASSDPKDVFIPIKRMMLWLGNTQVLTYFGRVDSALNRRLIESVVDSSNIWLNGLKGQGAIIAGETVFAEADNPTTDLLAGKMKFRTYWTPPPPAESISFLNEYDAAALATLFG